MLPPCASAPVGRRQARIIANVKDYRNGNRYKALTLDGETFVQRFLLHVLPKGLMRIRHYGFLANRCRRDKLARIRRALAAPPAPTSEENTDFATPDYPCPKCRRGRLLVIGMLVPGAQMQMAPG
ncbi:MAG: transposase [Gammaproteobacteria bacterium]|nr:transposase [Gammaproteobacteria bacterium]